LTKQNWLYWHKSVNVDEILEAASKADVEEATTFSGLNTEHRKSKVSWMTGNIGVLNLLWPYVAQAGEVMGVDVTPKSEIQYTEYHGSEEGRYDWHHDIDWNWDGNEDRKLSVTIQLSDPNDYEGGYFEFAEVEQPDAESRDKGTVLVFPSYLQHRVAPVTSGVRKSLVAWFHGPNWR